MRKEGCVNFEAIWLKLTNDAHVPIAMIVFAVTSIMHFWHHVDLGANYTNSIYALYGFLGAHAASQQVWPDKPQGGSNGPAQ